MMPENRNGGSEKSETGKEEETKEQCIIKVTAEGHGGHWDL